MRPFCGENATEYTAPCGGRECEQPAARLVSLQAPARAAAAPRQGGSNLRLLLGHARERGGRRGGRRALWPVKRNARSAGLKFHTITLLSSEPVMSCFMFGFHTTELTASRWPRKLRSSVGSSP